MATVTGIACKVGRGIPRMATHCVSLCGETPVVKPSRDIRQAQPRA